MGRRALAASLAAVAACAGVFYTDRVQVTAGENRYRGLEPTADWVRDNAASDHRVGIAGQWTGGFVPTATMFGPRFGNHVAYLGKVDRGLIRPYERREAFVDAVRKGRYDLLLIGRQGMSPYEFTVADLGRPPESFNVASVPEQRWANAEGFETVAASQRFLLLRRAP